MLSPITAYLNGGSGTRRPAAVRQNPLPPFDSSDGFGDVHTSFPPEFDVSKLFYKADFNGVNISEARWGTPPFLVGANSTPITMLMTTMLGLYPRKWQDACLTEHAERGYPDLVISDIPWNTVENGRNWSIHEANNWIDYIKSWGFNVVLWTAYASVGDPYLKALADKIKFHIIGTQVDGNKTAEEYAAILDDNLAMTPGLPSGAHFFPNYPVGFPSDTFITNWDKYNGRLHLCWQANSDDSAGKQGAMLYYARQRVKLGLIGGNGNPAPDSEVIIHECMATNELYGECTEEGGCLKTYELLCCPQGVTNGPVMGFGNGGRMPNGDAI
jgi:hypothetical protein